jgi:hypothetical protein
VGKQSSVLSIFLSLSTHSLVLVVAVAVVVFPLGRKPFGRMVSLSATPAAPDRRARQGHPIQIVVIVHRDHRTSTPTEGDPVEIIDIVVFIAVGTAGLKGGLE